jgi:putative oxidoreductase
MKTLSSIVATLLGLMFVVFGLNFFLQFMAIPSPPDGTPASAFLVAMIGSGYFKLVKVLEILGGVLLLLPRIRNWGLVIIGAIVVNIASFHLFFFGGIKDPIVIFAIAAVLFLAYVGRRGFCCLACCGSGCCAKDGESCCSTSTGSSSCCSSDKK